jgi:hypothetical protein
MENKGKGNINATKETYGNLVETVELKTNHIKELIDHQAKSLNKIVPDMPFIVRDIDDRLEHPDTADLMKFLKKTISDQDDIIHLLKCKISQIEDLI